MNDFEKPIEAESKDGQCVNNADTQCPRHKNAANSASRLLMLGFAAVLLSGAAFSFWPTLKGSRKTPEPAAQNAGSLRISGILHAEDNPAALVNGKLVYEGDVIDGARVVRIFPNKVEFENFDRRWSQSPATVPEGAGSDLPMLLQLGSHGCPPCRKMMPILDKLKRDYAGKFQITFIDVWKDRATGAKYGVRAIPTQIFYDGNGKEMFRHVGYYSEDEIVAAWEKLGFKL